MKILLVAVLLCLSPTFALCTGFIIDHKSTDLSAIPDTLLTKTITNLRRASTNTPPWKSWISRV